MSLLNVVVRDGIETADAGLFSGPKLPEISGPKLLQTMEATLEVMSANPHPQPNILNWFNFSVLRPPFPSSASHPAVG
jgi:hypothetical protein